MASFQVGPPKSFDSPEYKIKKNFTPIKSPLTGSLEEVEINCKTSKNLKFDQADSNQVESSKTNGDPGQTVDDSVLKNGESLKRSISHVSTSSSDSNKIGSSSGEVTPMDTNVVASKQDNKQTGFRQSLAKYGRIQMILGPMFSGKSTELLRKLRVFECARHNCLVG